MTLAPDVLTLIAPSFPAVTSDSRTLSIDGHDVELCDGVARPLHPEGDAFFGLEMGTNGTAAEARRACVRDAQSWKRSNHRPAVGVTLVPPSITCSTEAPKGPWGSW